MNSIQISEKQLMMASFDVFDTVLTRAVGSPVSSFLLLGNKLKSLGLIDSSAESFARARAMAERRAFQNAGGIDSHVTLDEIYAELAPGLRLSIEQTKELVEQEKQLERTLLHPVAHAKEIVEAARAHQMRVAFISDMYLGCGYIKQLLIEKGLFKQGDKCYVSSDYGKTKHSGKLYTEFLNLEGLKGRQVMHCGNHPEADVKFAQLMGLQTRSFYEGNLNRYERILEEDSWATEGLSSVMAGASRLTRLTVKASTEKEKQLRDVSASVAGPLLTGFVLWILRRSQKLGLKRLYFVSRDGQILLEIAKRLISKLDYECELRYLYGSRQAWTVPSVRKTDPVNLDRLFNFIEEYVTVYVAFNRSFIKPEEIKQVLETNGFPANMWERNLNKSERDKLKELIYKDKDIHAVILAKAEEKRKITMQYLQQEGFMEDVKIGMIDIGFGGSLHTALSEILDIAGRGPITSFYVAIRPIKYPLGVIEGYFFDRRNNTGFHADVNIIRYLLEIICSADHGSVISYEEKNGQVVPLLTELNNQKVLEWGYEKVRETICCFADTIVLDSTLVNPWADVREALFKSFRAFWFTPTTAEAYAWGSFMMEDGWGKEAKWVYMAEEFQWKQLPFILRKGQIKMRDQWWSYGALVLTPPPLQTILKTLVSGGKWASYMKPRVQKKLKYMMLKYKLANKI